MCPVWMRKTVERLAPVSELVPREPDGSSPLHYSPEEIGESMSRVDQLRAALLGSGDLDSLPAPEAVIDGVLYRDTLAWLHGKPGHGKSFIALDWAGCVSVGLPWQGCVVSSGPVLYVIAEGVTGLRQRVRAWEDYAGCRTTAMFLPVAVQFLAAIDIAAVTQVATELQPVLIVVDTQARVTVGADENSARDMGLFVAAADKLRAATRACVLVVHHESRAGENMRGSTALEGAAATIVRVTKDGTHLDLENPKQKDAPEFETVRLQLVARLDSAVVQSQDAAGMAADRSASEQQVIDALRDMFGTDGAPGSRLAEVIKLPKTTYYRALKALVGKGEVVNIGSKKRTHFVLREHVANQPEFTDE